MEVDRPTVLRVTNITKTFPGVRALENVDFECKAGEIHGLVGANGSGKSTLVSIASGALSRDKGTVEIAGHQLTSPVTASARGYGLATVYQDTSLIFDLTAAQNLFLSALPDSRPSFSRMMPWARERLEEWDMQDIDPETTVTDLSPGNRQLLEFMKALISRPKVLLLDEPTAALSPSEVDRLHAFMLKVAERGTGIVYVSHRLPEVLEVVSRITVLRDGMNRGTHSAEGLTMERIVELMIGNRMEVEFPPKGAIREEKEIALSVEELYGPQFGPISVNLRKGEILGLAGAEGNGQREIVRALAGLENARGTVTLDGERLQLNSVVNMLREKVIMLSGDRARDSIFPALSIRDNMGIHVLKDFGNYGYVSEKKECAAVADMFGRLGIVAPTIEVPIMFLSGGNQQKVVTARAFLYDAKVVLIDEPTQGVDARSRLDIYMALRDIAAEGVSIIVKSSDPHELAGLCDRVVVASRGHIVRELEGDELTERNIVSAFVTTGHLSEEVEAAAIRDTFSKKSNASSQSEGHARWIPTLVLAGLIALIGAYASMESSKFLSQINALHLFRQTLPLALVGMAQLCVLLVGGFDISVGSMMSVTVVVASFLIGRGTLGLSLASGILVCIGSGLAVGAINAMIVRKFRITPVIATIATLGILQGVALLLRPVSGGLISKDFIGFLTERYTFIPIAFMAVIVGAIVADFWLYRSADGLATRGVGFREEAAMRIGIATGWIHVRAYLLSSLVATLAGFFLACEVGVGIPTAGADYTMRAIAVAVLGGASLFGGKGSFLGCLFGAFFLSLTINIIPFLEINSAYGVIISGVVTLLAILLYSGNVSLGKLVPKKRNK